MSSSEPAAAQSSDDLRHAVSATSQRLLRWLVDDAMPVWSTNGVDTVNGGFEEALDIRTAAPCLTPKRARVAPRQVYSLIEAGRLGWNGDWQTLSAEGLDWFIRHYQLPNGLFASVAERDGAIKSAEYDLYNQAFALFAFSQIAAALEDQREAALAHAETLLSALSERYKHPLGGFVSNEGPDHPLCSNPHMHLFEAALELETVSSDQRWSVLADEIADLALTRFIDPVSGGLREFFAQDWSPRPDDSGRVMEPGHQFEWCWLLTRWGTRRGNDLALAKARRLYEIGKVHGIDAQRQVAIMALNDDFSVRDPLARLWGQTEWLKAALIMADQAGDTPQQNAYLSDALKAAAALELFLADVPAGLWRDKQQADGSFVDEPAPASSFYHIVCAISELRHHTARP